MGIFGTKNAAPSQFERPTGERGRTLRSHLNEHLRGIPEAAIIEEWSSTVNEKCYPRTCPRAVAEAFFMYPHDEAVDFFERYVFPVSKFDEDYDLEVMSFVSRCRNRALSRYVRDSVEQFGSEETIRRIIEGFEEDPMTATRLQEVFQHGQD